MTDLHIEALDADVTISRDRLGIPLVTASTEHDLFLGQGFATAEDRLGQMEWDRRRAYGRSAELHGSPTNVVDDGFHRRVRLGDRAQAGYHALDAATRAVLDAYVAGVNAARAVLAVPAELAALGATVEEWAPWDPVAVYLVRHVSFATWQTKLWNARVAAALGVDAIGRFKSEGEHGETPVIVPPGTKVALDRLVGAGGRRADGFDPAWLEELSPLGLDLSGSNAWAVHGSRTASGAPLIAGDPHRTLEVPNVYYQVRLRGPDIDVAGISFVGVPGIQHFAQTPTAAWAVTNAMADYQDLYVERLPEAIVDGRVETITVRDGDDVTVECSTTRHGPVVVGGRAHGVGLALASTGLVDAGGSLRTILPMLRARSVAELAAALGDWVEPANNFVLADDAGHIAYRTAGRVPRRHPLNRYVPVPGWDEAYDWSGTYQPGELPAADDPRVGAIVTANQRLTDDARADELAHDFHAPHRANRIWARLGDRADLTVEDQRAIHTDAVWLPGLALAERLIALGGAAAERVRGWDGELGRHSTAAAFAARVFDELVRRVTADLPAALRSNPFAGWEPPATAKVVELQVAKWLSNAIRNGSELAPGIGWAAHLPAAVEAALGEPEEAWGDRHRLTPRFGLAGADPATDAAMTVTSPPLAGGQDCVFATNQLHGMTTRVVTGSTARYVWDLADRTASRWVVPLGASGDPASPHFTDQLAAWSTGGLHPVLDDEITSIETLLH